MSGNGIQYRVVQRQEDGIIGDMVVEPGALQKISFGRPPIRKQKFDAIFLKALNQLNKALERTAIDGMDSACIQGHSVRIFGSKCLNLGHKFFPVGKVKTSVEPKNLDPRHFLRHRKTFNISVHGTPGQSSQSNNFTRGRVEDDDQQRQTYAGINTKHGSSKQADDKSQKPDKKVRLVRFVIFDTVLKFHHWTHCIEHHRCQNSFGEVKKLRSNGRNCQNHQRHSNTIVEGRLSTNIVHHSSSGERCAANEGLRER
mmetsp:Transcript_8783/g.13181  ORF Transcript_8783/g.13181 Transcript_8783/m.13181 type:complete len:256 (-) Transcript_8783:1264-2031(-)